MLKKGNWLERRLVTDQGHDRTGQLDEKVIRCWDEGHLKVDHPMHEQLGCVFSRHDAAEVYSPEEHRHAETNPMCEIHQGYCASH